MQFSSWNPCQSSNLWLKCHFDEFPSNYVGSHEAIPDVFGLKEVEGQLETLGINNEYNFWRRGVENTCGC